MPLKSLSKLFKKCMVQNLTFHKREGISYRFMDSIHNGEWRRGTPPCALSDTDVNLSAHPAPIIQPSVLNDFAFFTGSSHKMVDL
jgi:hypothetical protein